MVATQNQNTRDVSIGIWGGAGAGKTTYLWAMQTASVYEQGHWRLAGQDQSYPGSNAFLAQGSLSLNVGRKFPPATLNPSRYSYSVSGRPSQDILGQLRGGGLFGRPSDVNFMLNFLDQPGGNFQQLDDPEDELWRYLAECQGIVYLYDPELEGSPMPNYTYLFAALPQVLAAAQRFAQDRLRNNRLGQYLAICLAKYDEPQVFQRLMQESLIRVDRVGPWAVPRVTDAKKAFDLFAHPLTTGLLQSYFLPERIQYFSTSSIGFYSKTRGTINVADCYNVERTPNGPRIRGEVYPINVFTPFVWLAERSQKNP